MKARILNRGLSRFLSRLYRSGSRTLFTALLVFAGGSLAFAQDPPTPAATGPDLEELAGIPFSVTPEGRTAPLFPVWRVGDSADLWNFCRDNGLVEAGWTQRYRLSDDGGKTWESLESSAGKPCRFEWLLAPETAFGAGAAVGAAQPEPASKLQPKPRGPRLKPYDADIGFNNISDKDVLEMTGQYLADPSLGLDLGLYYGDDLRGGALTVASRDLLGFEGLDLTLTGGLGSSKQKVDFGAYGRQKVDSNQKSGGLLMQYDGAASSWLASWLQVAGYRFARDWSGDGEKTLDQLVETDAGPAQMFGTFRYGGGSQKRSEFAMIGPRGVSLSLSDSKFMDEVSSDNDRDTGLLASLGLHDSYAKWGLDYDLEAGYADEESSFVYDVRLSSDLIGKGIGVHVADDSVVKQAELFLTLGHCNFELFRTDYSHGDDDTGVGVSCSLYGSLGPKGSSLGNPLATDLRLYQQNRGSTIAVPVRGAGIRSLEQAGARTVSTELVSEETVLLNNRPVARIQGVPASVSAGQAFTVDGSSSSDADGQVSTFAWTLSGPCRLQGPADGVTAVVIVDVSAPAGEVCQVQLEVTDNQGVAGNAGASAEIVELNQAPVARISGVPAQAAPGSTFVADGTGSGDADGQVVGYSWTASGSCSLQGGATGATVDVQIDPQAAAGASCQVALTVTDDEGATGAAAATASVVVSNLPPVAAISGVPSVVNPGQVLVASSADSVDPDGVIVSRTWSVDGQCSIQGASDGMSAEIAIDAQAQDGDSCQVHLNVTDDDGATGAVASTASVVVSNLPPLAEISGVPPDVSPGQVFVASSANSVDADGRILLRTWSVDGQCSIQGPNGGVNVEIAIGAQALEGDTCRVFVSVTDDDGAQGSASAATTVVVPNNLPPQAVISRVPATVLPGQSFFADALASSDPDGTIVANAWSANGACSIQGASDGEAVNILVAANAQDGDSCQVGLTVTDDDGAQGSASAVTTVVLPNLPPVAVITGFPDPVIPGARYNVSGAGSSDPEGSLLAYAWSAEGACSIAGAADQVTADVQIDPVGTPGTRCDVSLTVTDDAGATGSTTVGADITNVPPTAVITGVPATAGPGDVFAVSGSESSDPEGPIAAYAWSATGPCSIVGPANASVTDVVIDSSAADGASCTLGLTVADGQGATDRVSAVVPILNLAPTAVITGAPATIFGGETFVASGASSSDPEGAIAGYAWSTSGVCSILGSTTGVTATVSVQSGISSIDFCTVALTVADSGGATGSTSVTAPAFAIF